MTINTHTYEKYIDTERKAIVLTLKGKVTPQYLNSFMQDVARHLEEGGFTPESPGHAIFDITQIDGIGIAIKDLGEAITIARDRRLYWNIVMLPPGLLGKMSEYIINVSSKMARGHVHVVATLQEAFDFLDSPENPYR